MPFTILDDYPPFPASLHVCCSCGAGRRTIGDRPERIVSLGFPVEIATENGAATGRDVYAHLCETCALEVGQLVGLVTTGDATLATDLIASAEAARDDALTELADVRSILDPLLARLQAEPAPDPVPPVETAPPAKARAKRG